MDSTDQPNSICHISAIQMYPLNLDHVKMVPFQLLTGEAEVHTGISVDGIIVITNYRLFLQIGNNQHHIPLGLIEVVEHRELFYLHIGCKDARTYRCTFENNETCMDWYDRVQKAADPPRQLEQLFAFYHCVWCKEKGGVEVAYKVEKQWEYTFDKKMFENEMIRMGFEHSWRISTVNQNYKLCPTYPPYLLVPSCISDEILESVAKFRSSRRIPAVVWRHTRNGAVIARCSQPEVGWFGWRLSEDEDLIKAISEACSFDALMPRDYERDGNLSISPSSMTSDDSIQITDEICKGKKVLIMDARSYTTAVANRARGGGCECPEYYPNCEIQFMNLPNIHSIRKSFHALRQLCTSSADQPNWFSQLEGTRWLLHMSGLMKAALTLVTAVERDARPVLVHCSDGWDRTPQIVALAELLLDAHYRTIDGFRILIEREWLAFGHKFADRCGHSTGSEDQNERCPVFLQWLDCVHQLLEQFPCAFEFSQTYLVKLAQHAYSNLFGTFLCNTHQERMRIVGGKTFSVWEFLSAPSFRNHLYAPVGNVCGRKVLWPQCNVRDLKVWSDVYLGAMESNFAQDVVGINGGPGDGGGACPGPPSVEGVHPPHSPYHMTKTRSYGDLLNAGDSVHGLYRRNSDPSINSEIKLPVLTSDPPSPIKQTNGEIITNGHHNIPHTSTNGTAYLQNGGGTSSASSDVEDNCATDCLYKRSRNEDESLTDDQIDGLEFTAPLGGDLGVEGLSLEDKKEEKRFLGNENIVIIKTDNIVTEGNLEDGEKDICDGKIMEACPIDLIDTQPKKCSSLDSDDAIHPTPTLYANGYTNGITKNALDKNSLDLTDADSENSLAEENTESKSEITVCDVAAIIEQDDKERFGKSVETSTETLVSENAISGSSPREINGFEKVLSPKEESIETVDSCRVCAQNSKGVTRTQSGEMSRYSTPKPFSRASSSSNGWGKLYHQNYHHHQYHLGEDGLIALRSPIQERLDQIVEDQKRREDLLQKELHTYRQARIKQVCHKCNAMDAERLDDNSDIDIDSSSSSSCKSIPNSELRSSFSLNGYQNSMKTAPLRLVISPLGRISQYSNSVAESVGSAGEGQTSAVESLRSDMSWEALEEGSLADIHGTLWVPDHAVSRCTGCQTQFWLGRRKHHCRKCGRIFCADCSEYSTPLPSEQLYDPVRVCTGCYSKLSHPDDNSKSITSNAIFEETCKHVTSQTANNNQQIAASSN